ncbi:MAG: SRPBCC family protein [Pseudomonadota bacterium]
MKFSCQQDIDAPLEAAFAAVADLDYLERQLLRRGIEVVRTDARELPGTGMGWAGDLFWRGQTFPVVAEVVEWAPSEMASLSAQSGGLRGGLQARFTPLSRGSTRVRIGMTITGAGFRDKMLLQTVKLAKARLDRQFSEIVAAYLNDAWRRAAA